MQNSIDGGEWESGGESGDTHNRPASRAFAPGVVSLLPVRLSAKFRIWNAVGSPPAYLYRPPVARYPDHALRGLKQRRQFGIASTQRGKLMTRTILLAILAVVAVAGFLAPGNLGTLPIYSITPCGTRTYKSGGGGGGHLF